MALTQIGVISDTHGLLRPKAVNQLLGVDKIIHAGDIGSQLVLEELRKIAPVVAVRGNVDKGNWAEDIPDTELVTVDNTHLYVLHDIKQLNLDPVAAGIDVVISGHSHRSVIEYHNGVLYLNPGAAGPQRFKLPVSLALLTIRGGVKIEVELIALDESDAEE